MLSVSQAVIVEGKYDKIRLSSVLDGVIICTDGFGIFTDKDKMRIIRHYADSVGIIILTDSDAAGFKIRSYLKGSVRADRIINVYIPDIFGKERRKALPSKEGKLGVEGMDEKTLYDAFAKAGITPGSTSRPAKGIDKLTLYELGLTGAPDAVSRRRRVLEHLGLPGRMTPNSMTDILNTMISPEELRLLCEEIL